MLKPSCGKRYNCKFELVMVPIPIPPPPNSMCSTNGSNDMVLYYEFCCFLIGREDNINWLLFIYFFLAQSGGATLINLLGDVVSSYMAPFIFLLYLHTYHFILFTTDFVALSSIFIGAVLCRVQVVSDFRHRACLISSGG